MPKNETNDAIYEAYVERARANMHVVFCMSPVGDSFRNRCRMYPALVNCTTIDWFSEWPRDALREVALKYLDGVDVGSTKDIKNLVCLLQIDDHVIVLTKSICRSPICA